MLGMRFDLRVPDFAPVTTAEQYQTCLEMADWADRLGFDFLALSEHHASPDGYLPAPIPLAAAILGRTGRIGVNIAAVLLVLHDPIRVAEELAVVDLFAPGRITVTAGLGYRAVEFEMAGVDKKQRGKLLEEYVGVLRQAWTGEPFEWRGRTIQVTPRPATPGGPMILMGGGSEAAARRATAPALRLLPVTGRPGDRRHGTGTNARRSASTPASATSRRAPRSTWSPTTPTRRGRRSDPMSSTT